MSVAAAAARITREQTQDIYDAMRRELSAERCPQIGEYNAVSELANRINALMCPEDNGELIDEAWLRSVGAKKHEWHPDKWTFFRDGAMPVGLWIVDDGWKAMLIHTESSATCMVRGLKTRGDVRRLCAALQIPLKGDQ